MKTKLRIFRFNPERDKKPYYKTYVVDTKMGSTILSALDEIKWHQDGTLTYRSSCRSANCGSCALSINGKASLACKTQITGYRQTNTEILIEPLRSLEVIKDLVVEMTQFYRQVEKIQPWLICNKNAPQKEYVVSQEETSKYLDAYWCVMCGSCYSECNVTAHDRAYLGPAAFVKGYRFIADSRDSNEMQRLTTLTGKGGIWECTRCNFCWEVCPKRINHNAITASLGALAFTERLMHHAGARHAKSILYDVLRVGKMNELLLCFRTQKLRVISNIPLAIRMAIKRKIAIPFLKRIHNIEHVRRIFRLVQRKQN